jgi:hypothetical protein
MSTQETVSLIETLSKRVEKRKAGHPVHTLTAFEYKMIDNEFVYRVENGQVVAKLGDQTIETGLKL